MTNVIINPGTGVVPNANAKDAIAAAEQMVKDVGSDDPHFRDKPLERVTFTREPKADEGGRYGFVFMRGNLKVEVDIPGLPLERLRYLGDDDQNIWHFPRLYVDGSSWMWVYAVNCIRDALDPDRQESE